MTLKIRVKANFDLTKILKDKKSKITKDVIKEVQTKGPPVLIKSISESLARGNSPVSGFGRFVQYSNMYINMMRAGKLKNKKPRPVNLFLTGEMIASLTYQKIKNGFSLIFKDKKAALHNKGKGKLPVRKIFPVANKGEKWKPAIVRPFKDLLQSILSKIVTRSK